MKMYIQFISQFSNQAELYDCKHNIFQIEKNILHNKYDQDNDA